MAKASLKIITDGIGQQIKGYLDRSKFIDGYLNRTVYPEYQNRQRMRWQTENTSEGTQWKSLKPEYAERKKSIFASYEGSGTKMMIATGRLFKSVIGPGKDHRKIVSNGRLTVSWTTPYAIYTEDVRPVNEWDPKQDKEMYDAAAVYLIKGEIRAMMGGKR